MVNGVSADRGSRSTGRPGWNADESSQRALGVGWGVWVRARDRGRESPDDTCIVPAVKYAGATGGTHSSPHVRE